MALLISDDLSMAALAGGLGERAARRARGGLRPRAALQRRHGRDDRGGGGRGAADRRGAAPLRRWRGAAPRLPAPFDRRAAEAAIRRADGRRGVMDRLSGAAAAHLGDGAAGRSSPSRCTRRRMASSPTRCGDDTALRAGPRHASTRCAISISFGTILLPLLLLLAFARRFLFGYAKPVPVPFRAAAAIRAATWCWWRSRDPGSTSLLALSAGAAVARAAVRCRARGDDWLGAQSLYLGHDQRRPGRLQHDPAAAARWRPGRGRVVAEVVGGAAGADSSVTAS